MGSNKVKYSFAQWCLDNNHEDWLDLWDYELNSINPYEIAYRSGKKYYFKCKRGIHSSELKLIGSISADKSKMECNQCSSFGQWLLDEYGDGAMEKYWSDKNETNPFMISKGNSKTWIYIKCQSGMHPDYKTTPHMFSMGCRCGVCAHNIVVKGINDIATLRPDLIPYFLNAEDAYTYAPGSNKYVDFLCPTCGSKYHKRISHVVNWGLSCDVCSVHTSYPNKFVYECMRQLKGLRGFVMHSEHIFEWSQCAECSYNPLLSGEKIYDLVIEFNNQIIIIENHGPQHYDADAFYNNCGDCRGFEMEQQNDHFKYELAINNAVNLDEYVVLDCRRSECDWIKRSIMNSGLPDIFDFKEEDIDWHMCELATQKSFVDAAVKLWNNATHDLNIIASEMGISKTTLRRLLRIGTSCNLCDYGTNVKKPILCLDDGLVFSYSGALSQNSYNLYGKYFTYDYISKQARKNGSNKKSIHLSYITREEFVQIKETEPHRVYE